VHLFDSVRSFACFFPIIPAPITPMFQFFFILFPVLIL
jgi:hypothetical protein